MLGRSKKPQGYEIITVSSKTIPRAIAYWGMLITLVILGTGATVYAIFVQTTWSVYVIVLLVGMLMLGIVYYFNQYRVGRHHKFIHLTAELIDALYSDWLPYLESERKTITFGDYIKRVGGALAKNVTATLQDGGTLTAKTTGRSTQAELLESEDEEKRKAYPYLRNQNEYKYVTTLDKHLHPAFGRFHKIEIFHYHDWDDEARFRIMPVRFGTMPLEGDGTIMSGTGSHVVQDSFRESTLLFALEHSPGTSDDLFDGHESHTATFLDLVKGYQAEMTDRLLEKDREIEALSTTINTLEGQLAKLKRLAFHLFGTESQYRKWVSEVGGLGLGVRHWFGVHVKALFGLIFIFGVLAYILIFLKVIVLR